MVCKYANTKCHAVYIEASSMELQCSEIKSADDNNDANECSYDDGTSTGMFTVSLSPFIGHFPGEPGLAGVY